MSQDSSKSPLIPHIPGLTPPQPTQSQTQPPFKKSKWTPEEDKLLIDSVKKNGMSNWTLVAAEVYGRTGKQCRERWTNQLCPALNKDIWTPQEDEILIKQQRAHGNFWSKIARYLPGRSSNAIKNRWSWLSRHGVTSALNQQMCFAAQVQMQPRPRPPLPQIYQIQQTAPMEFHWQPNVNPAAGSDTSNFVAFSEPNALGNSFGTSFSANSSMFGTTDEENEPLTPEPTHDIFSFPQSDTYDINDEIGFGNIGDDISEKQFWGDDNF